MGLGFLDSYVFSCVLVRAVVTTRVPNRVAYWVLGYYTGPPGNTRIL